MDIFSIFRNAPAAQEPTPASQQQQNPGAGQPGNIPPQTTPAATPNNGVVPSGVDAIKTPLDDFASLWKNDPTKQTPDTFPTFNVDPAKVQEAAGKIDFTKVLDPTVMDRIKAGGTDAQVAMMEAMNKMTQASYAQTSLTATKIVEQALNQARTSFNSSLPGQIKAHQLKESLRADNPAFSHPAVAPVLDAMQNQMRIQYPQASAAELQEMAKRYVSGIAEAFGTKPAPTATEIANNTDWDKFLSGS
jgi:hypothetical protein